MNEDWIIGEDFNEIVDDSEKSGGRRKLRVVVEDFRKVIDDLTMVDIKLDKGWFTWANNRRAKVLCESSLIDILCLKVGCIRFLSWP